MQILWFVGEVLSEDFLENQWRFWYEKLNLILYWSESLAFGYEKGSEGRQTIGTAKDFKLLPEGFPDVKVAGVGPEICG